MTRNAERVLLLGLGALVTPLAQILAARLTHRHWLALTTQENQWTRSLPTPRP